jgi:hypothetical protein
MTAFLLWWLMHWHLIRGPVNPQAFCALHWHREVIAQNVYCVSNLVHWGH